ncbi:MAG TPA: NnrS family protein [Anaerolineae bacterium]|nr:NnrS family protein [Anaerolineae bacterium]
MNFSHRIHEPFIYAALLIALTAGFGYGALLVGGIALGVIPGAWWGAVIQAHGHAQLFGWLGLFVLGMGLYFLPKLRGAQLQGTTRLPYAVALLVGGIALRVIVQPLLGFNAGGPNALAVWKILWGISAALELAGILLILSILRQTERIEKPLTPEAPAYAVEPFARIAFLSLTLAFILNALGVGSAVMQNQTTLAAPYETPVITLMLYGLALPMAIVFSVRNLPLFMRLALPRREVVRQLTLPYALGLFFILLPSLIALVADLGRLAQIQFPKDVPASLEALGWIGAWVLNGCILILLWELDLLHRRPPWTTTRAPNTRPDLDYLRKPTRANYPDAREYGRFELLIYSAYVWLVSAVLLNLARILAGFIPAITIPQDAARHALAIGFITLLIFGMAVRMTPGFSHKKGIAYPRLVLFTFLFGNLAAFLRVVPTFFPDSQIALSLWGLSGLFSWTAVAVLAVNLFVTFRQP